MTLRVTFVANNGRDLRRYLETAAALQDRGVAIEASFLSAARNADDRVNDPRVRYVFDEADAGEDDAALHARLAAQYRKYGIPLNLYRADRRYIVGAETGRTLAREQAHLVDSLARHLDTIRPRYMLLAGGPELSRNVACALGQVRGIETYRILSGDYFNPHRGGVRLWFCANNYRRLNPDRSTIFRHDAAALDRHVESVVQSLRAERNQLDVPARAVSQYRSAYGVRDLAKSAARTAVDSTLGVLRTGRPPSYNPGWRRLRTRLNFERNRPLSCPQQHLPARYFLFPLNVPDDAQLTLRAPQYVDQFTLCTMIACVLPFGCGLVIREHPGQPGMLDHGRLKRLLRNHTDVRFVDGMAPIGDLLGGALGLLTINSTSALEAMLRRIPVITLGESYYRDRGLCFDVSYPFELQAVLSRIAAGEGREDRTDGVRLLLREMLEETYPAPGVMVDGNPDLDARRALFVDAIQAKIEAAASVGTAAE